MMVRCDRCNNSWDYNGNGYWAQCPRCKFSIKIKDTPKIVATKGGIDIKAIFEDVKKHPPTNEELMKIADKDAQI